MHAYRLFADRSTPLPMGVSAELPSGRNIERFCLARAVFAGCSTSVLFGPSFCHEFDLFAKKSPEFLRKENKYLTRYRALRVLG